MSEPEIIKKADKKCWPWQHVWTHWQIAGPELIYRDTKTPVGNFYRYQRRHCVHCGYIEQTRVGPTP